MDIHIQSAALSSRVCKRVFSEAYTRGKSDRDIFIVERHTEAIIARRS